jgi:hypothetical protein
MYRNDLSGAGLLSEKKNVAKQQLLIDYNGYSHNGKGKQTYTIVKGGAEMVIKIKGAAFLLGGILLLSACSQDATEPEKEDTKTTEENQTETQTGTSEEESASETEDIKESGDSNEPEKEADDIEKQEYDSAEEAAAAIDGYRKVDQTNIDLGHGIKGFQEGAAGHEYISWNEGRWLIQLDFPTDPQYVIDGYEGGSEMAKKVVEYLESHYLPAPHEIGMITINGFKEHPETVVKWQEGKTVYSITSKNKEPFDALATAVESEGN